MICFWIGFIIGDRVRVLMIVVSPAHVGIMYSSFAFFPMTVCILAVLIIFVGLKGYCYWWLSGAPSSIFLETNFAISVRHSVERMVKGGLLWLEVASSEHWNVLQGKQLHALVFHTEIRQWVRARIWFTSNAVAPSLEYGSTFHCLSSSYGSLITKFTKFFWSWDDFSDQGLVAISSCSSLVGYDVSVNWLFYLVPENSCERWRPGRPDLHSESL